jgi:hypothetical protein
MHTSLLQAIRRARKALEGKDITSLVQQAQRGGQTPTPEGVGLLKDKRTDLLLKRFDQDQ